MRYIDGEMNAEAALRDLQNPEAGVRVRAADALGRVGISLAERAGPALRGLLADDSPEVRYAAALSLGELGDRGSVSALIEEAQGDGHPLPRQAAVIALGLIGDVRATRPLVELLRSGPPDVRFQAATSLVQVNPEAAPAPLVEALADLDPEVRASAAAALGDLGWQAAADALSALLEDSLPMVRVEAAVALSRLGDLRGSALLAEVLADPEHQHLAAEHLFRLPDPRSRPALQRALGLWMCPALVKVWVAGALARLGDEEGRRHLLRLLGSRRPQVQGLTIQVLSELGQAWAVDALRQMACSAAGQRWRTEIAEALHRAEPASPGED